MNTISNMNQELIDAIKSQYSTAELQHLINTMQKSYPLYSQISSNVLLVKKIINSIHYLSAYGVRQTILKGGWTELSNGSDINMQLQEIITNPAIVLYTQILLSLALSLRDEMITEAA